MASPNTPNLDTQILKLRRLLGDINNEDGVAIDSTNVYTSTSGVTWKQQELLDIYNDAIRQFMLYLVQYFPKENWWEYLPGYITYSPEISLTSGVVELDSLDPTSFQLIDVRVTPSTEFEAITDLTGIQAAAGLLTNGDYFIVVVPIDKNGEGPISNEVKVTIAAGGNTASIALGWTSVTDATGYKIYISRVTKVYTGYLYSDVNTYEYTGTKLVPGIPLEFLNAGIEGLVNYIPPQQWFACLAGMDKIRKPDVTHRFYSILAINNSGDIRASLIVAPSDVESVDLIYLRDHIDFIQDSADRGDIWGISQDGMRRILTFAEVIARRWKSTEAADVPEAMLKQMIELDTKGQNNG